MRLLFVLLTSATVALALYDPANFWWVTAGYQVSPSTSNRLSVDVEKFAKEYLDNHDCDCCEESGWYSGEEWELFDWKNCDEGSGSGDDQGSGSEISRKSPDCFRNEEWIKEQFTTEYLRVMKQITETAVAKQLQNRGCCNVLPVVPECSDYFCENQSGNWETVFASCSESNAENSGCVRPLLAPQLVRFMKDFAEQSVRIDFETKCEGSFLRRILN